MGIVFQRHKINNYSASRASRDNERSLCGRLLWEFSNSRVIFEVSHACCCGVCPFRSLSHCVLLLPATSPFLSVFLTHPLSLYLHRPYTSSLLSVVSADCCAVGEKRISRVLEFWWEFVEDGACCDRVSLRFRADGGERSWGEYTLMTQNALVSFDLTKHVYFEVICPPVWWPKLVSLSQCVCECFLCEQLSLLADCCCGVSVS